MTEGISIGVDDDDAAADEDALGVLVEVIQLAFELFGHGDVVGVHPGDVLSAGASDHLIQGDE